MTSIATLQPTEDVSPAQIGGGQGPRRLKKVLWVNDRASELGGCERYTRSTAERLALEGVESALLYDANSPTDPDFLHHFAGAFPAIDVAGQVRDIDPDVIYVQQIARSDTLAALVSTGRPVVRFFHDHKLFCLREHKYDPISQRTCERTTGLGCYACPGFIGRGPKGGLMLRSLSGLRREQAQNRRLSASIVGSHYMKRHLEAHGFDPGRVHTVPLFAPRPNAPPRAGHGHADRPGTRLLFVGRITRGKGLDLLLHAIASLLPERITLTVIGDGPQAEECRVLARRLGLAESVSFLGHCAPDVIDEAYRDSTALVLPSRTPETFGLVGVEAMSNGLPTIASQVGGIGEWLDDGVTGLFFRSGDVADLARCIERVHAAPELAGRMGTTGREVYRRRFTPELHTRALMNVLTSIAETGARGRVA